jgi:hypothetical protein
MNGVGKVVEEGSGVVNADSKGWRSAFRTNVDHDSEVMPISIAKRSRSVFWS